MSMENIKVWGQGIKSNDVAIRWKSRHWQQLACLFIENSKQSKNINYLLENYIDKVVDGIKVCMQELEMEKCQMYLSECYNSYVDELEKYGFEVILVDDKKKFEKEVFDEVTLVHNAETMLAISRYLAEENYIPKKIISLAGDVKDPGIYEIQLGTSLRDILNEYGKGTKSGKQIKFVQVGGDTGNIFGEEELDTPFIYSKLMGKATMLETGKIEVFNTDTCVVKWSFDKMLQNSKKTCGKCVYCREGIYQLYRIIKDATEGKGKEQDLDLVTELCVTIKINTLCDFGKSASNPVYSAVNKFKDEFEKHIERKICNTLSCISYVNYFIDPEICNGCGQCLDHCHINAINGGENLIHIIDTDSCDKCGDCENICSLQAVKRYGRIKPQLPSEPIAVGSFKTGDFGNSKGLGLGRRRRRRKKK